MSVTDFYKKKSILLFSREIVQIFGYRECFCEITISMHSIYYLKLYNCRKAWNTVWLWLMAAGKQKKLIYGMEGKNAVAYGRMPSPSHFTNFCTEFRIFLKGLSV